jgi:hypothetical protein
MNTQTDSTPTTLSVDQIRARLEAERGNDVTITPAENFKTAMVTLCAAFTIVGGYYAVGASFASVPDEPSVFVSALPIWAVCFGCAFIYTAAYVALCVVRYTSRAK